ncbi:MAG TPA: DUF4150 domain-containing protein [Sandaracinaceae bacterium LLY-WYZ-13_1]|nr:DUF4150 domain-containing protein [Sandaracinaceae bacterium LLY-WYZ-13_1]
MFANTQLGGLDTGMPDVCLTPAAAGVPVPVPYPNVANGPTGVSAVYHVLFSCAPAHTLGTSVPLTNGDNAGVNMGVASGTVMGPSRHLTGAFTCLVGGQPASRLTSVSLQNNTNCPGARVLPSQVSVMVLAP